LALALGISPGSEVDVGAAGKTERLRVAGIMNSYTVNQAYVSPRILERLLGRPLLPAGALLSGPPEMALKLSRQPNVIRILPGRLLASAGWANFHVTAVFVKLYGHLGALIALVLISAVIGVNISDRAADYAVLRSLGFSKAALLHSLFVEVLFTALCSLALSYPFTRLSIWVFQQRIMQIAFWVPVDNSFGQFCAYMLPVLAVMMLAVIPAWRRVERIPAAAILRARVAG
jgi:ABC-type antimicrobial peptide transport system permease subunit